jgi:non-ribosomal peptide synthetase component F
MWLAFHAGATLVVPAEGGGLGGPDLAARLSEARVTVLSCAAASLAALPGDISLLRLLILRGGRCSGELVQRWARADRRIVSTYGHTETTVVATHAELLPGGAVTAGRPLHGCRVYILDGQLRCIPWGSLGQIAIGGPGVARGYLGLPADTRARFVRDPFSPCGDGRMYLTGDLGRIDPNGNLEVLGETGRRQRETFLPEGSRS